MYQLKYNENIINYEIERKRIKNLYIYIKDGKVLVKAPIRLKEKHIQEFVNRKSKWINEKIKEDKQKTKIDEEIYPDEIENLKKVVEQSVKKYGTNLKIKPNKVTLKKIKYAWGSCSSKKNISINLNLAKKSDKAIEYVVLHEMCHLIYMNHSQDFWNLVKENMEEYKEYKKELK